MRAVIEWVTRPETRKFLYRVAWAVLLLLVANGKLTQEYVDQILVAAAAIFGIADYNTGSTPAAPVTPAAEPVAAEAAAAEPVVVGVPATPEDVDVATWLPTK